MRDHKLCCDNKFGKLFQKYPYVSLSGALCVVTSKILLKRKEVFGMSMSFFENLDFMLC